MRDLFRRELIQGDSDGMNWTTIAIVVAVVVALLLFKKVGQISAQSARELLAKGAVVIDVRTPAEFAGAHLKRAINIPLDQVEAKVPLRVAGKATPILLHCASGMRSGAARSRLKSLGFTSVHNLGSYSRAAQIVEG